MNILMQARAEPSAVQADDAAPSPRRAYQRLLQQRLLLGLAMLAALAVLLLIALGSGSYQLGPSAVAAALVAGPLPADQEQRVAAQVAPVMLPVGAVTALLGAPLLLVLLLRQRR